MPEDQNTDQSVPFCVLCFGSADNSSWGEQVTDQHCMNCGAGGSAISIPRWAIDSIRKNASWVGKRYYPNEEDIEDRLEAKRLRKLVTNFPGRTAQAPDDQYTGWVVRQKMPNGRTLSMGFPSASSEEEALDMARTKLPYYDEESLGQ